MLSSPLAGGLHIDWVVLHLLTPVMFVLYRNENASLPTNFILSYAHGHEVVFHSSVGHFGLINMLNTLQ